MIPQTLHQQEDFDVEKYIAKNDPDPLIKNHFKEECNRIAADDHSITNPRHYAATSTWFLTMVLNFFLFLTTTAFVSNFYQDILLHHVFIPGIHLEPSPSAGNFHFRPELGEHSNVDLMGTMEGFVHLILDSHRRQTAGGAIVGVSIRCSSNSGFHTPSLAGRHFNNGHQLIRSDFDSVIEHELTSSLFSHEQTVRWLVSLLANRSGCLGPETHSRRQQRSLFIFTKVNADHHASSSTTFPLYTEMYWPLTLHYDIETINSEKEVAFEGRFILKQRPSRIIFRRVPQRENSTSSSSSSTTKGTLSLSNTFMILSITFFVLLAVWLNPYLMGFRGRLLYEDRLHHRHDQNNNHEKVQMLSNATDSSVTLVLLSLSISSFVVYLFFVTKNNNETDSVFSNLNIISFLSLLLLCVQVVNQVIFFLYACWKYGEFRAWSLHCVSRWSGGRNIVTAAYLLVVYCSADTLTAYDESTTPEPRRLYLWAEHMYRILAAYILFIPIGLELPAVCLVELFQTSNFIKRRRCPQVNECFDTLCHLNQRFSPKILVVASLCAYVMSFEVDHMVSACIFQQRALVASFICCCYFTLEAVSEEISSKPALIARTQCILRHFHQMPPMYETN